MSAAEESEVLAFVADSELPRWRVLRTTCGSNSTTVTSFIAIPLYKHFVPARCLSQLSHACACSGYLQSVL